MKLGTFMFNGTASTQALSSWSPILRSVGLYAGIPGRYSTYPDHLIILTEDKKKVGDIYVQAGAKVFSVDWYGESGKAIALAMALKEKYQMQ